MYSIDDPNVVISFGKSTTIFGHQIIRWSSRYAGLIQQRHAEFTELGLMARIPFFSTGPDSLHLVEAVEAVEGLQYVRTGNQLTPNFETFLRAAVIPNLGIADHETGSVCSAVLIAKTTASIRVRTLTGSDGGRRYLMDQLLNLDSVTFTPAGMWGDDIILQGTIGTASSSKASMELMKKFQTVFNNSFTKVRGVFIGPQALAMFKAGKRLTHAVQSPAEFDLHFSPE
jgi:hypothetical protein